MNVGAISVNKIAFKGELNSNGKETGGRGKAWCSAAIPGLGQFLDGRNKEGAIHLGAAVGLLVATVPAGVALANVLRRGSSKTAIIASITGMAALGIANVGLWMLRVVDAYKGKVEPKTTETAKPTETKA